MTETLIHAYLPLIFWTGLGLLVVRFIPKALPRLLGRTLYWVGVPVEILALARRTDFSERAGLAPTVTVVALLVSLLLASLSLWVLNWITVDSQREGALPNQFSRLQERSSQGSFILSAMLGNTGFIGLAIAPLFVSDEALSLVVFYSITHNTVGTYGLGVFLASYYGRQPAANQWWTQIWDVLCVPTLWAFIIGVSTQHVALPAALESGLQSSLWFVIPSAFLLMGIRLGQIQGWQSFQIALIPACLKVVIVPVCVVIGTTLLGISADSRLALVLMSGMPTAFAGLILAEEYDLDRELIASSIVVTAAMLLLLIPFWLVLFT